MEILLEKGNMSPRFDKGDEAELGGKITIVFVSIGVSLSLSISQLRAPLGGGRANRCAFLEGKIDAA